MRRAAASVLAAPQALQRRLAAAVGVVTLVAVAASESPARADTPPSAWDAVRDPEARDRYLLHARVRETIAMGAQGLMAPLRTSTLEHARSMLEEAGAAESPDPVLRFDLGEVYEMLRHHELAVAVLVPALKMAPDHPAAIEAYRVLADAYANLDRSAEERDTYDAYLARAVEPRRRATAMLNQAEAEMHLGDLSDAIAEYRATIEAAAELPNVYQLDDNTLVLAYWGLAVALDRAGDVAGGAAETKLAMQLDPGEHIINFGPNVFFVPRYEVLWYLGLAAQEHAREAKTARESAAWWCKAETIWKEYVTAATPKDRWLGLARARRDRAVAQRIATQRRAGVPLVCGERGDKGAPL